MISFYSIKWTLHLVVLISLIRCPFVFPHEYAQLQPVVDFRAIYNKYNSICKNGSILVRENSNSVAPTRNLSWSLYSGLLQYFLDFQLLENYELSMKGNKIQSAPCNSCTEIADIIRNYSRNAHSPVSCRLSWFTKFDICVLLSKYSLVWLNGDSLTRHVRQAFHMIAREDFRIGGIPSTIEGEILKQCVCDGIFSEHELCRSWYSRVRFGSPAVKSDLDVVDDQRGDNVCRTLNSSTFQFRNISFRWSQESTKLTPTALTCSDIKIRPVFLYLAAGVHVGVDAKRVIEEVLRPILRAVKSKFRACLEFVTVVCSGATVCTPAVETQFPNQERHRVEQFNNVLSNWLKVNHPTALFLNFWNITRESTDMGLTSDGIHLLSDTNMLIALALMNIMNVTVSLPR